MVLSMTIDRWPHGEHDRPAAVTLRSGGDGARCNMMSANTEAVANMAFCVARGLLLTGR
jgi:hypothetical protein